MRVTEDNLELAKLRYDVGHSGKDEVYRWQAELFARKQSLFDSKADVEAKRIVFNQVLVPGGADRRIDRAALSDAPSRGRV